MALQFPPTDILPPPTTGTIWLDPNGVTWRATVLTVDGNQVITWTPDSIIQTGAFMYRGFADLTQPVPHTDTTTGTIYSVLAKTAPVNINSEWGNLSAASGGNETMEANQLIICTQDTITGTPQLFWAPVATPVSPWIRDGSTIRPINQGDSLEVKYNGVAGGDIELDNYTELP